MAFDDARKNLHQILLEDKLTMEKRGDHINFCRSEKKKKKKKVFSPEGSQDARATGTIISPFKELLLKRNEEKGKKLLHGLGAAYDYFSEVFDPIKKEIMTLCKPFGWDTDIEGGILFTIESSKEKAKLKLFKKKKAEMEIKKEEEKKKKEEEKKKGKKTMNNNEN
jgi:hypothetical protein